VTGAVWLSLVLTFASAGSTRLGAREETRIAGCTLGLAIQPLWIWLCVVTGAWGFLVGTVYWIYTYLRVAGWWPGWLPTPRWPGLPLGCLARPGARRPRSRDEIASREPVA
jgi:hypothetical protein